MKYTYFYCTNQFGIGEQIVLSAKFGSLNEALVRAWIDMDDASARPLKIADMNGKTVFEGMELKEKARSHRQQTVEQEADV
ncbi:MAG: hypothetical protein OQK51_18615 [Kangiellaceae bacterium]|nr:hypothetical protein [Kangiellaceae bacterium]